MHKSIIGMGIIVGGLALVTAFTESQEAAEKARKAEQARKEQQVLQAVSSALSASAQYQAAQAREAYDRNRRIQENAAGVSEGIRQAERRSLGIDP